jgi:spore maturation protein CgeB
LVPQFDLYLSFTGGPTLARLERNFGAQLARALYCSADTEIYKPLDRSLKWDLGYIGTYSADRQPALEKLLIEPLRMVANAKGVVAGPQYPSDVVWPTNVRRIEHLAPNRHRDFYAAQRFTLNVTRRDMVHAGFSPSIRLFEAAATGTPIISDWWQGLDQFFAPGKEIIVAESSEDVLRAITSMSDEQRRTMADRARARVLEQHTASHRAIELEKYICEAAEHRRKRRLQLRRPIVPATRPAVS